VSFAAGVLTFGTVLTFVPPVLKVRFWSIRSS